MCIKMVCVYDKYCGVWMMVDIFLKKDKSGGGGVLRFLCRYMLMYEIMVVFDKFKLCYKCLIYDM